MTGPWSHNQRRLAGLRQSRADRLQLLRWHQRILVAAEAEQAATSGWVAAEAEAHAAYGPMLKARLGLDPGNGAAGVGQKLIRRELVAVAAALRQAGGVIAHIQLGGRARKNRHRQGGIALARQPRRVCQPA